MKIAIDVMGGDHGLHVTLPAALLALERHPDLELFLVGQEAQISEFLLKRKAASHPRIHLQPASEEVRMDELPSAALRGKKDSSMRVAIDLVKKGQVQACVSAGNTGALMATARFVLKTIAGIDRPAIVYAMPRTDDNSAKTYMLDLGANVDCTSEHLYQFALMGSVLAEASGLARPKVALLNIGQEEMKGIESIKEASRLLTESPDINYIGFIEGNDLFSGKADVIVCDGFIGNIALKTIEGTVKFLGSRTKVMMKKNWHHRFCSFLALPFLLKLKQSFNLKSNNGASFLGLNGIVIKSHGGADIEAFLSAIEVAISEVQEDIPNRISKNLAQLLNSSQGELKSGSE